jgi:uncharacterized membrane protein
LSASSPSGITSHIAASTLTLKYNQPAQTTISLIVPSKAADGKYTVTITGHDGRLSHSANITLQVVHPYFLIMPPTDRPSIAYPQPETYQIQLKSVNMFSGSITLKAQATDFSCTFSPSTITLSSGQSKNTTLALSVHSNLREGGYPILITGTDDHGIMHTYSFIVEVIKPDFTISVSPLETSIVSGKNVYFTLRLQSINRFNGSVSLSSSHPIGLSAVFSSSHISLDYKHANNAFVTISVPSGTTSGKYTVSIIGSSVYKSNIGTITIHVLNP